MSSSNPLRDPADRRLPRIAGPSGLVIFGVTGDLSRKKLMPAVYDLANRGLLPPGDLARILEGIDQLPDDRREALIMRFALGMDNREIARALGRTDGATKVLIHRATRQLQEIVAAGQAS